LGGVIVTLLPPAPMDVSVQQRRKVGVSTAEDSEEGMTNELSVTEVDVLAPLHAPNV